MLIENADGSGSSLVRRGFARLRRPKILVFLSAGLSLIGLFGGTALYCLYLGAKLHRDHYIQGFEQTVHYVLDTKFGIPLNYFKGMLATPPEKLVLNIDHVDYQKLASDRARAFENGSIKSEYVPATLTHDGCAYDVKVRLAGSCLDHVASDKWSLSVKMRDEHALFGMNRFKLLAPKIRYGVYEWVCHELSRSEGLIALRTDFVSVNINGNSKGVYYLEEEFDKHMLESNGRREGILFRPLMPIRVIERDRVLENAELRAQLALVESLWDRFLADDLPASQLFDVEKLAKYYAITDLVGGVHQLIPVNVHLYFNPITGRLEPIGREWDVHFYRAHTTLAGELNHGDVNRLIHVRTLSDPVIFSRYVRELERLSRPEFLEAFFSKLDPALTEKLKALYREYPHYSFSKDYLYKGQRFIAKSLNNSNAIRAYVRATREGDAELLVANRSRLPLEVVGLRQSGIALESESFPKVIPRCSTSGIDDFAVVSLAMSPPTSGEPLKVRWRVLGASETLESDVLPWPFRGERPELDLVRREPNHRRFPFVRVDEASATIFLVPGEWELTESLILPPGHVIYVDAGVSFDLKDSACIVAYSAVEFRGTPDRPIVIRGDGGGGQGLIVFGAKERSILEHVHMSGLSNPRGNGWQLTGAVTFYESPVDIRHCRFSANSDGDDLVNIVRCDFTVTDTVFSDVLANALAVDFGTGRIADSRFISCGNDAIDVSASRVEIERVFLDGIGYKGISAGEESRVSVVSATIRNTDIGMVSKDRSDLVVRDVELDGCRVGFAAYQKKPEFGPGTLDATDVTFRGTAKPYLVERRSKLSIDGRPIEPNTDNASLILYGEQDGASR